MSITVSSRGLAAHAALVPLALALSLVTALTDTQKPKPRSMPSFEEMQRMRVVYALPGMDAAVIKRNVAYKTADQTPLLADVYAPPTLDQGERRPAIVFVHGGPLPPGPPPPGTGGVKDWGVFVSYGQLAAASDFVGVTFNHRYRSPEMASEADGDVADLVAYVRKNAAELGVDHDRIALWAFSGGGIFLARWLAEPPPYLRALVSYYAVLDAPTVPPGRPDKMGGELRARLSPVARLETAARPVPLLVARAGQDHPQLNATVDAFVAEALKRNVPFELLNHPEGRHGFDILDDDPRSREIIARTLAFLKVRLAE